MTGALGEDVDIYSLPSDSQVRELHQITRDHDHHMRRKFVENAGQY